MENNYYIDNLNYVKSNDFLTEDVINRPIQELKNNLDYIFNLINGNKLLYSTIFGNLLDFDKDGHKICVNSGKFDSAKKVYLWTAINDFQVVNDEEIFWDENNHRLVYRGWDSQIVSRKQWIEKEVYIPEHLRGQHLIFSVKAAGSTQKFNWNENNSVCESIAIEIINNANVVRKVVSVGYWDSHLYFSNPSYLPKMTTYIVPFKTNYDTKTTRIKIFRTKNTDYLHIDKMYLGFYPIPYSDFSLKYQPSYLDINELYDFYNNSIKLCANNVLGHKVADRLRNIVGNDLVTWYQLQTILRNIFTFGAALRPTSNLISLNDQLYYEGFIDTSALIRENEVQGTVNCEIGTKVYTVSHPDQDQIGPPMITLEIPSQNAQQIVISVSDITNSSFKVILSNSPQIDGYKIHWVRGNTFSPSRVVSMLTWPISAENCLPPISGGDITGMFEDIYNYEREN